MRLSEMSILLTMNFSYLHKKNPIGHRLDVGNTVTQDLPAYKGEMLNVGHSSAGNLLTAKCSNQQPLVPPYPDNLQQSAERCLQSPTSNLRSSSNNVDVMQPGQPKANFVSLLFQELIYTFEKFRVDLIHQS
ncbi:hypothetical protein Bpfe_022124 [Biomphalaria pfeifferi]|uniref:Uncharacterized protein n=1 Tax=Biomphalaria pfeifferi TaxID=112525 RepID=A0AAD8B5W0_BIOPF|nr:hypothetical protein Bpfe_022124 [Biomphalaria pfeifferi]